MQSRPPFPSRHNNVRRFWLLFEKKLGNHVDHLRPKHFILVARFACDFFQTIGRGLHQAKAEEIARALQLNQPPGLPFLLAPLRHGHIHDVPFRFAQEPQRQSALDGFVVGMRRKK